MFACKKLIKFKIIVLIILFSSVCHADNHNLYETLELIQKDLKTLEKAVYSGSINAGNVSENLSNSKYNRSKLRRCSNKTFIKIVRD